MRQVFFKKGKPIVREVPKPNLQDGMIAVEVHSSCISPGTEAVSLSSSGKTLLQKAREHPEKVRNAIDRMKTEGISSVLQKARAKQEKELVIGYSAAGVVIESAQGVKDFKIGDRVAIYGAGYASHAEYAAVPVNMATLIPSDVSFRNASTCALGGIALQGVRRAQVEIGELVAVIGCGPIGLLTVQLLKAAGCQVIATDLNTWRLKLASELGADYTVVAGDDNLVRKVMHLCGGYGADKVIITASTRSDTVLSQAFGMSRKKGRVVLVGVVGERFNRADMYAKELDFVVSTSYGAGRYDERYERFGVDYPYAYVRWTEKRNIHAYLQLVATGKVQLNALLTASFSINEAGAAYKSLTNEKTILVTLHFETKSDKDKDWGHRPSIETLEKKWHHPIKRVVHVGIAGAGSFVQSVHIQNLKTMNNRYAVKAICNQTGASARHAAGQLNGCIALTDFDKLLASEVDMILIGTRHNLHADFTIRALKAGKAVLVEKPMCITWEEYQSIEQTIRETDAPFMVGYNRRFSPFAKEIKQKLSNRVNPLLIQYTVNAGYVPYDSWVHTEEGGGRIVGEACHIVDLFRYLVGYPAVSLSVTNITPKTDSIRADDNLVATLKYKDGSVCTMIYTGIGAKEGPKESMLVFCDEQLLEMSDYKTLTGWGVNVAETLKRQDKGHYREMELFSGVIQEGRRFLIPWQELEETWKISRQIADSIET